MSDENNNHDGAPASQPLPPPVAILRLLTGKWVSQAISVAAEMGLADQLALGPRTPADLATACGCDARSLERLLRALASVGVFAQDTSGRFENSPLSDSLRAKAPGSMRAMAVFFGDHPTWDAWGELGYSVKNGESAFQKVHGELPFAFWSKHPREASFFNEAMTGFSAQ